MKLSEFLKKYSVALGQEEIEELKKMGKSIEIELDDDQLDSDRDILNKEETEIFVKAVANIRQHGVDCVFYEGFTPEQAIIASQKVGDWVNEINSARIKGRELTPFEKYLYAYEIATRFIYNSGDKSDDPQISRNINHVLTGDKIVCVGFSSVLRHILNGLGIPCSRAHLSPTEEKVKAAEARGEKAKGHAVCLVYIDDPKYGIKGSFISDPTNNSLNPEAGIGQGVRWSLISLSEVKNVYGRAGIELLPEDLEDAKNRCYLSVYLEDDKMYRRETTQKLQFKFLEDFNGKIRNKEKADEYIEECMTEIFEELDGEPEEDEKHDLNDELILNDKMDGIVDAVISACHNPLGREVKNPLQARKSDIKQLLKHYSPANLMRIIKDRVQAYASLSDEEVLKDRFGVDLRDFKGLSEEESFDRYMLKMDMATQETKPLEWDEYGICDKLLLPLYRIGKAMGMENLEAEAFATARCKSWTKEKQDRYLQRLKDEEAAKEADEKE